MGGGRIGGLGGIHRGGSPGFAPAFHARRHHGGFQPSYGYSPYDNYGYDGCDTPYRWHRPAYCY
jgi:hypothetical protein